MFPEFVEVGFSKYKDQFTTGIFVYRHASPVAVDRSSTGAHPFDFIDLDDNHSTIEVTVKFDEFAAGVENMWKILCADPELFKTKFWKKGGSPRDMIRTRIAHLILALN